jgi:type IV pilus assembly protein PilB
MSADALLKVLEKEGLLKRKPHESFFEGKPEGPIRLLANAEVLTCREEEVLARLSELLKIPYTDLEDPEVRSKLLESPLTGKVTKELCFNQKLIPLWQEEDTAHTAMVNPYDLDALKALEFTLGLPITPHIVAERQLVRLMTEIFGGDSIDFDELESTDPGTSVEILGANTVGDKEVNVEDAGAPPVVKLCNKIMADAVSQGASDIHIEPMQHSVEVRFRVDGVMQNILEIPRRLQSYVTSRFKLLADMDIAEKRRPQDGRLRVLIGGEQVDMRVSSIPASYGEKVVLRLLYSDATRLSFPYLNMPEDIELSLKDALSKKGRLLLVTGPTGSGKTTTLYTALNFLRDGTSNIQTVEDPIEYRLAGINQVQVNDAIDVTFASALRSILRQDPDIIMVGEIRDKETATIAFQAAQTGHLVLSTLHTNDAPSAISRLLNLDVDPFMVASTLAGVLAQRLVRKVCEHCEGPASKVQLERWQKMIDQYSINPENLRAGSGCNHCRLSGYKGRIGVFSYISVDDELSALINKKASTTELEASATETGYRSLHKAAIDLVQRGMTTLDEVKPYIQLNIHREHKEEPTPEVKPTQIVAAKPEVIEADDSAEDSDTIERPKLLLIEDDPDVRSILAMLLRKEMFEVVEACNGQEGIEAVYNQKPTVILCDLMMPVMDGREFLLKMKGNKKTQKIPVIILTAVDSEENEIDLLEIGAVDFVSKSSSSNVMLTRIRRILSSLQ